jgi:predicted HTH transcriptional regulator
MELQRSLHEEFAQFLESPTRKTLRELLRTNQGETDQLDFKESWPDLVKMAKHVIAIGNSGGGAIVIGMKEKDDGSLTPVGLDRLLDKSDIGGAFEKYIPSGLKYEVIQFDLSTLEYAKIEGDRYQVVLVYPDKKEVPYLPKREGSGIKQNQIYVRRDTRSVEANRTEIERLIKGKVNAIASSVEGELEDDLRQLKTLCEQKYGSVWSTVASFATRNDLYDGILDGLIEEKTNQIRKRIGV